jgi:hypothetical protein
MDPYNQGHILCLFGGVEVKGLAGAAVRLFSPHDVAGEFFGHQ